MRIASFISLFTFLVALGQPSTARADVLITPFAGVSFIDDDSKRNFGASIGFGGLIGFEVDASQTRIGSYEEVPLVDLTADITTIMANLVVRVPAGPVQPYASGGAGLMRLSGDVRVPFLGTVASASARDWGMNVGGGVHLFPSDNFGIRGDVRYFRSLADLSISDLADIGGIDDLPLPKLDFWRATVGITFKF
jgi:opacity protein-like surface antigen